MPCSASAASNASLSAVAARVATNRSMNQVRFCGCPPRYVGHEALLAKHADLVDELTEHSRSLRLVAAEPVGSVEKVQS